MNKQESKKHHYVPQFLLKKWMPQDEFGGYLREKRSGQINFNPKGAKFFCQEKYLFSTPSLPSIAPDALESDFFKHIDDKAALGLEKVAGGEIQKLSPDQRCDIVRLLLSLEVRRPATVQIVLDSLTKSASTINDDPEVKTYLKQENIVESATSWFERTTNERLEDHVKLQLQALVDNPQHGKKLQQAYWFHLDISEIDGQFILGDRPIVQTGNLNDPKFVWALPINPKGAIFISPNRSAISKIQSTAKEAVRKALNFSSVRQAEKYVFMVNEADKSLLQKHLTPNLR